MNPTADPTAPVRPSSTPLRIGVVGSGWHFTSGISHYTFRIASELAKSHLVTVVLMRRLIPLRLYPGRARVGTIAPGGSYGPEVRVIDGVDWFWFPSIAMAVRGLFTARPQVLIFQWWTVAVLHTYILLALAGRMMGAKVVVEFHETQDVGEAAIWPLRLYMALTFGILRRLSCGAIVHSSHDHSEVVRRFGYPENRCEVILHGPYDHLAGSERAIDLGRDPAPGIAEPRDAAHPDEMRLLYFGVVRPYKGLDVLADAIDCLSDADQVGLSLTVAGEPWEGFTEPLDQLRAANGGARVSIIDRYVSDAELRELLASSDAVVLPYKRSSASGPLHVAMSCGLPVIVTSVGGLTEVASRYEGATVIPPDDPAALASAIVDMRSKVGRRYPDPVSWGSAVEAFENAYQRWCEE